MTGTPPNLDLYQPEIAKVMKVNRAGVPARPFTLSEPIEAQARAMCQANEIRFERFLEEFQESYTVVASRGPKLDRYHLSQGLVPERAADHFFIGTLQTRIRTLNAMRSATRQGDTCSETIEPTTLRTMGRTTKTSPY